MYRFPETDWRTYPERPLPTLATSSAEYPDPEPYGADLDFTPPLDDICGVRVELAGVDADKILALGGIAGNIVGVANADWIL